MNEYAQTMMIQATLIIMSYKNRKYTEQVFIIIACMSQIACPTSLAYLYAKTRNTTGTTVTALLISAEGCQFDATELN
jgi:hypothetical protein